ncbi:MAG: hypothetical protein HC939_01845 [Pleurocapsa sp. SU_5_0]|nr:hypothetical protein [Pleurocapsa sp. SU_5_0]NJO94668.1 hypothetical protein [Pleurocapsa sp. CRU_1_2]
MINSQFSQPLWLATYNLSPRRVTKFLLSIIALLVLFNLLERGIVHWLNAQNNGKLISVYFNFDEEGNLPSLYSSLALGFSSYLLAIIASLRKTVKGKYARQWKTLSLIFLYLAIDENCGIHELLIPVFKELINAKGLLYFPWVVPAFCLIVVFLIIYRKFILALPRQTKVMFLLSGTIYIFGALVMEMIGGYIADHYGYQTVYGIVSTIEELSEMFGIVIFINALLNYLQSQVVELNFALSFQQPEKK